MTRATFRKPVFFIGAFALLGLILLPAVFFALSKTVPDYNPFPVQILLWPSSFAAMGLEGTKLWDSRWITLVALIVGMNGVLYGLIGALLWVGFYRWRGAFIVLAVGLLWGLYKFVSTFSAELRFYWDFYWTLRSWDSVASILL